MKFTRFIELSTPLRWLGKVKSWDGSPSWLDRCARIRIEKWSSTNPDVGVGDLFSSEIRDVFKDARVKMTRCSNPGETSDLLTNACRYILCQATEADWDRLIAPHVSALHLDNPGEWRALWEEVRSELRHEEG